MKVAIVGSGIAGVSAAYHLDKAGHACTIFEKSNYFGGHTDTHTLDIQGEAVNIDSGFIVFAKEFYPHFSAMLNELGIHSKPTKMSFSASNANTGLVYNATNLSTLFCQRRNILNPRFYRMIIDICRFYQSADSILNSDDSQLTAGEYFEQHHFSSIFQNEHIYPMISALWSTSPALVKHYPIQFLVEYLHAHGMMKLWNRPVWRVLNNGSFEYQKKLKDTLKHCHWKLNCGVSNIIREKDRVLIHSVSAEPEYFDAVILACHANQATFLLQKPSRDEKEILNAIGFEKNTVTIHTDDNIMPKNTRAWASWNTQVSNDPLATCSATYWMNELQGLAISTNVFVSLNEERKIRKRLHLINGQNRTAYAGAYWGWAFHEDGARTGYEAAQLIMEKYR